MEKKNITFNKNPRRVAAANLYITLNKKLLITLLRIFSIAGLASALAITLGYVFNFSFDVWIVLLKLSILLGLISFGFLRFICGYLGGIEKESKIDLEAKSFQIFDLLDFESINIISQNSSSKMLTKIFQSNRVKFIIQELNIVPESLGFVGSTLKSNQALGGILELALDNAVSNKSELVSAGDIFWGLLKSSPEYEKFLNQLEIDENDFLNVVFLENSLFEKINRRPTLTQRLRIHRSGVAQNWSSGYTLFLDRFSIDLSGADNSFSIEGRENIVREIEDVLTKESKNNCILTGSVGVGKSTLIQGLASKIKWGKTLPALCYKRIVQLDVGSIISAAKNQADLEKVLRGALGDAVRAGNVIIYIDDIHTLFSGDSKSGTVDATEIILPFLESSELKIIGSTTENYFQTYISSKPTIAGNFTKIAVEPTDKNQTIRVLADLSLYFSQKYRITITYAALKEVFRLSERFVVEKDFPGRAVDMFENLCSAARNNGIKVLDKPAIDSLSEKDLNVPIAEAKDDEKEKLLKLDQLIHSRVVGQDEAVKAISDAMRRVRAQVTDSKRPIGSFLFLGPTGVGKTELAKALAWAYFGSEDSMIRMDMNEYQKATSVDQFIGKKLTGSEQLEGGEFVKKVREHPFSVVLLDEIEKAHPNILDLFLQILDEGYFTDGMGERVIFSNSIVIATSNAGANLIREGVKSGLNVDLLRSQLLDQLQKEGIFKPEFLNRFDGAIIFNPLTSENILEVAKLMFAKIEKDMSAKGYSIQLEQGVIEQLAKEGYQPEFGARPMRRVFQDKLENFLANEILKGNVKKGEPFVVRLADIK